LKDVAQPVGEADRHVKNELKKKVRGVRDVERQAEQSLTTEAQVGADYGLAMRTVMRDDGQYPLEPPGVQLYQKLPLMAASVERVRALPPSALLQRLSRRRSVLNLCHQAYEGGSSTVKRGLGTTARWCFSVREGRPRGVVVSNEAAVHETPTGLEYTSHAR
jgi:hypothetical protein